MRIAEVIRTVGTPFIIGADWQNTPNRLLDSGFLSMIKGVAVSASQGTCFSYLTKKWSEIDFFVVSEGIAHAFDQPTVDLNATTTPHLPVCVNCSSLARSKTVKLLAPPKAFPHEVPIGPRRRPRVWPKFD